jgi:AraC-like DNA-binding protein
VYALLYKRTIRDSMLGTCIDGVAIAYMGFIQGKRHAGASTCVCACDCARVPASKCLWSIHADHTSRFVLPNVEEISEGFGMSSRSMHRHLTEVGGLGVYRQPPCGYTVFILIQVCDPRV